MMNDLKSDAQFRYGHSMGTGGHRVFFEKS